jgi:hypothetical protein
VAEVLGVHLGLPLLDADAARVALTQAGERGVPRRLVALVDQPHFLGIRVARMGDARRKRAQPDDGTNDQILPPH